jgi:2-keto-4-pentenoate hydratase/2-oxohepta-3-ene-1,7-dioic acid hydratase in catechol pathway
LKIGNVKYRNRSYIARKINEEILLYSIPSGRNQATNNLNSTDNVVLNDKLFESIKEDHLSPEFSLDSDNDLEFLPCILHPEKIVGVGFNYRQHADETKTELGGNPVLFSKYSDAAAGHRQKIRIPETVHNLDYEAEMAIVIGSHAFNVKEEESHNYIFGYCPANDLSARDLQFLTSQFLLGKTLPGFAPIGPYISTIDEVPDPQNLDISLKLNGETRQNSNTKNMIFTCNYLVSYITRYFPLNAGDIILTGTPGGVIAGSPPEKRTWMKPGDVTEVIIEKLGTLLNEFT